MTDEPIGVEVEPAVAETLFGDRIELARRFAAALAEHGEERSLRQVNRPAAASPATGVNAKHKDEQADLIRRAFED